MVSSDCPSMSMNPGATTMPCASVVRFAAAGPRLPMAAILPPRMATSAAYQGEPVPSMTCPLRIIRSYGWAAAASRRIGSNIGISASIRSWVNLSAMSDSFNPAERAVFRRLNTPEKIQHFLDYELAYNKEPDGNTCRSPRRVLRARAAHCMEGALFGAAALRMLGHPPLLLDLMAVRDDDHVLAIFRARGCCGAVAKSNYSGLRYREPVYRTRRELVMSYFEHYYNLKKEKTLRKYSRPVNLDRFDSIGWMTAEDDVWPIPDHLCTIAHSPILPAQAIRALSRVDERLFAAGGGGGGGGGGGPAPTH